MKKAGHYRTYQKYFWKSCKRRSFNDKTSTLLHYSDAPLFKWFIAIYLFFVLWVRCSIREASIQVDILYHRCYVFMRTLMERLKIVDQGTAALLSGKGTIRQILSGTLLQ